MEEDLEVSSKRRFDIYFGLAGFVLGCSISLEKKQGAQYILMKI